MAIFCTFLKRHIFKQRNCTYIRNNFFALISETHYIILHLFSKRPQTPIYYSNGQQQGQFLQRNKIHCREKQGKMWNLLAALKNEGLLIVIPFLYKTLFLSDLYPTRLPSVRSTTLQPFFVQNVKNYKF